MVIKVIETNNYASCRLYHGQFVVDIDEDGVLFRTDPSDKFPLHEDEIEYFSNLNGFSVREVDIPDESDSEGSDDTSQRESVDSTDVSGESTDNVGDTDGVREDVPNADDVSPSTPKSRKRAAKVKKE